MGIDRVSVPERLDGMDVAELFRAHHVSLVRLALLMVGEQGTAEDIVQDVYARLQHRHRRSSDLPDVLLAYARTAVLNACRTWLRRRALINRIGLAEAPRPVWSAEHDVVIAEDRQRVLRSLARLAPRQREAIVLRFYLDLSEAEIAATMRISAGTVKSTISRGLVALRARYEEES
jgi:RNA polymerase sigma-70 factor (sigma-E family)